LVPLIYTVIRHDQRITHAIIKEKLALGVGGRTEECIRADSRATAFGSDVIVPGFQRSICTADRRQFRQAEYSFDAND